MSDYQSAWPHLIGLLSEVYKDDGIAIWLRANQKQWPIEPHVIRHGVSSPYRTALDLIADGRIDEVIAAAEMLAQRPWTEKT